MLLLLHTFESLELVDDATKLTSDGSSARRDQVEPEPLDV
jgi:hypothetical protein